MRTGQAEVAGQGPAPAEKRRRRNIPARGEWVDLPPLTKPILPTLPRRAKRAGGWSARTRSAWKAWRTDPVTTQYGPAEIQAAIDLAYLYEEMVRGKLSLLPEIRQMQDRLGLNPKGKRDLRWRVPASPEVEATAKAAKPLARSGRRARLELVKS